LDVLIYLLHMLADMLRAPWIYVAMFPNYAVVPDIIQSLKQLLWS